MDYAAWPERGTTILMWSFLTANSRGRRRDHGNHGRRRGRWRQREPSLDRPIEGLGELVWMVGAVRGEGDVGARIEHEAQPLVEPLAIHRDPAKPTELDIPQEATGSVEGAASEHQHAPIRGGQ